MYDLGYFPFDWKHFAAIVCLSYFLFQYSEFIMI